MVGVVGVSSHSELLEPVVRRSGGREVRRSGGREVRRSKTVTGQAASTGQPRPATATAAATSLSTAYFIAFLLLTRRFFSTHPYVTASIVRHFHPAAVYSLTAVCVHSVEMRLKLSQPAPQQGQISGSRHITLLQRLPCPVASFVRSAMCVLLRVRRCCVEWVGLDSCERPVCEQ